MLHNTLSTKIPPPQNLKLCCKCKTFFQSKLLREIPLILFHLTGDSNTKLVYFPSGMQRVYNDAEVYKNIIMTGRLFFTGISTSLSKAMKLNTYDLKA